MKHANKCDYCDNEAAYSSPSPYECEMSDNPELVEESYFSCENPECFKRYEDALYESAMDI
jgi:hypothetical protein